MTISQAVIACYTRLRMTPEAIALSYKLTVAEVEAIIKPPRRRTGRFAVNGVNGAHGSTEKPSP